MTNEELKVLAEAAVGKSYISVEKFFFSAEATPARVLALIAENERLESFKAAYMEWNDKTEWVQKSAQALELGRHRADVLRSRIDQLKAESEALLEGMTQIMRETRMGDPAFAIACEVVGELCGAAMSKGERS